jgi:hypothetical protein
LSREEPKPVKLNEVLGKQPSIGILNANQILPISAIVMGAYTIFEGFLGLGFPVCLAIGLWGIGTWLMLTGNDPDSYLNLYRKPPKLNWTVGGAVYVSPLLSRQERRRLQQSDWQYQKSWKRT